MDTSVISKANMVLEVHLKNKLFCDIKKIKVPTLRVIRGTHLLSSSCSSRHSLHPSYPGLCPGRLTWMDHVNGLSCPLLLVGSAKGDLQQDIREEDEVGVLVLLASRCRIPLGWLQPLSCSFILLPECFFCSIPVISLCPALCLYKYSFY